MRKGKILTVLLVDTQDSLAEWMFTYLCWWEKWPKGMESRTDPGQLKGKWTTLLITLVPTLSHLQPLGHPCSVSNMLTCSYLRDQIDNMRWIIEKAREFQKDIYFCFIDYAKASDCVDHHKLWKLLKEMGIPDHLTCLLGNLYAG